jgi:hypothetical protein
MSLLSEDSGFGDDDDQGSALNVCKLRKCGHMLHHPCLVMYIKNSSKVREGREEREGEGEIESIFPSFHFRVGFSVQLARSPTV